MLRFQVPSSPLMPAPSDGSSGWGWPCPLGSNKDLLVAKINCKKKKVEKWAKYIF